MSKKMSEQRPKMSLEERARLLALRKQGKIGRVPFNADQRAFINDMYERFPEEYSEIDKMLLTWLRNAPWWELL
jgi:hypothetical protein